MQATPLPSKTSRPLSVLFLLREEAGNDPEIPNRIGLARLDESLGPMHLKVILQGVNEILLDLCFEPLGLPAGLPLWPFANLGTCYLPVVSGALHARSRVIGTKLQPQRHRSARHNPEAPASR
jgi:hypothetical protein